MKTDELIKKANERYDTGDFSSAYKLYKQAADLGDPEGARCVAWQLYQGEGCESNWEMANAYWRIGAEKGNVRSACNLGLSYLDGTGVPQSAQKAVYWLSKSAEGGDAQAILHLGKVLLKGSYGVEKDTERGLALLIQAATMGESLAFHLLIDYCIDVEHDKQKALHLVSELRGIGGSLSGRECVFLALEILTGKDSPDEEKGYAKGYAIDLLKQAIDYDYPSAALIMALCYVGGIAVEKNREMAIRFYRCASRLGSHLAERILEYYEVSE